MHPSTRRPQAATLRLQVSAIGPLLSSRVVQLWGLLAATEARRSAVGFAGLWGTCAAVYAVSPVCFALAQPSPQARRLLPPPLFFALRL